MARKQSPKVPAHPHPLTSEEAPASSAVAPAKSYVVGGRETSAIRRHVCSRRHEAGEQHEAVPKTESKTPWNSLHQNKKTAVNIKGILKAPSEPFLLRRKPSSVQRNDNEIIASAAVQNMPGDASRTLLGQSSYDARALFDSEYVAGVPTKSTVSEPALQKKRITPYKSNHNILRTDIITHIDFGDTKAAENAHFMKRHINTDASPAGVSSNSEGNEPALQKRKIVPYFRNHNILMTSTVGQMSNGECSDNLSDVSRSRSAYFSHKQSKRVADALAWAVSDRFKAPVLRKANSVPDLYSSTYDTQFSWKNPQTTSPVISADRVATEKKIQESSKVRYFHRRLNLKEVASHPRASPEELPPAGIRRIAHEDDVRLTRPSTANVVRSYDSGSYQTEYNSRFSKTLKLTSKQQWSSSDDIFLEYFRRVLDDRQLAYRPELLAKIRSEKRKTETALQVPGRQFYAATDKKGANFLVDSERKPTARNSENTQAPVQNSTAAYADKGTLTHRDSSAGSSVAVHVDHSEKEDGNERVKVSGHPNVSRQPFPRTSSRSEKASSPSPMVNPAAPSLQPAKARSDIKPPRSVVSSCSSCRRCMKVYNPDNYSDRSSCSPPA